MNKKQKICLCFLAVVFLAIIMFPPVNVYVGSIAFLAGDENSEPMTKITVFRPLFGILADGYYRAIDLSLLAKEIGVFVVCVAWLVYLLKIKIGR